VTDAFAAEKLSRRFDIEVPSSLEVAQTSLVPAIRSRTAFDYRLLQTIGFDCGYVL
jgi:hypothetical protein